MNTNDILSIGTVCTVKNETIMIIGYNYNTFENGIKTYDYVACNYPTGLMDITKIQVLNKVDINKILFTGYQDDAFKALKKSLSSNTTQSADLKEYVFDMNGIVVSNGNEPQNPVNTYKFSKDGTVVSDGKEATKLQTGPYIFDENGMVVADAQGKTSTPASFPSMYTFGEKENVITDGKTVLVPTATNSTSENGQSPYQFENGVVVADGKESVPANVGPYQFENGVVVADGKESVPASVSPYQFKDGVVVADGKESAPASVGPYQFENGVVVADGKESAPASVGPYQFKDGVVVADGKPTAA